MTMLLRSAIRDELGITPIHYHQQLNRLLGTEAALACDR